VKGEIRKEAIARACQEQASFASSSYFSPGAFSLLLQFWREIARRVPPERHPPSLRAGRLSVHHRRVSSDSAPLFRQISHPLCEFRRRATAMPTRGENDKDDRDGGRVPLSLTPPDAHTYVFLFARAKRFWPALSGSPPRGAHKTIHFISACV
jgi:hypothetical protein